MFSIPGVHMWLFNTNGFRYCWQHTIFITVYIVGIASVILNLLKMTQPTPHALSAKAPIKAASPLQFCVAGRCGAYSSSEK
jgi:hypothetical protein